MTTILNILDIILRDGLIIDTLTMTSEEVALTIRPGFNKK